jgi:hypothetical protein
MGIGLVPKADSTFGSDALERAILLTVGGLVSVLLAVYVNIHWLWRTGLLRAHRVQASFTGRCPVVTMFKCMRLPGKPGFT